MTARPADDPLRLAPPAGSRIAVAGGCGGFGSLIVKALLAADCHVSVLDLPSSLERHQPPAAVSTFPMDVHDRETVDAAFAALGRQQESLDGLAYLVGYTNTPPEPLETIDDEAWDDIQSGNLRGGFRCLRAATPLLRRAQNAAVVTVSSSLGFNLLSGFAPYGAAKAGLVGLTKAFAVENAPAIRANAVAPSAAHTAFMGGGMGRGGEDASHEWFTGATVPVPPLGRFCEPADVVGPVLFLLGPASRFMTGQVLHVSGGRFTP